MVKEIDVENLVTVNKEYKMITVLSNISIYNITY